MFILCFKLISQKTHLPFPVPFPMLFLRRIYTILYVLSSPKRWRFVVFFHYERKRLFLSATFTRETIRFSFRKTRLYENAERVIIITL